MESTSDVPLVDPSRTVLAMNQARHAARQTRQTLDVARAPLWAGLGLSFAGLGAFTVACDSSSPEWAKWSLMIFGLLLAMTGVVLSYAFLIGTWVRGGWHGLRVGSFSDQLIPQGRRIPLVWIIFVVVVIVEFSIFSLAKGRIPDAMYYGFLIWGTRCFVVGFVAFFSYRTIAAGAWEYLGFAIGMAGTWGIYIFFRTNSPAPMFLAIPSIFVAMAAAVSLMRRRHHWLRTLSQSAAGELPREER